MASVATFKYSSTHKNARCGSNIIKDEATISALFLTAIKLAELAEVYYYGYQTGTHNEDA